MKNFTINILVVVLAAGCFFSCKKSKSSEDQLNGGVDTPVLSFVVLGDSRVNWADTNVASNPSASNVNELIRTYEDISKMDPLPDFVFFNGDAGIGHIQDTNYLVRQLKAWAAIYTSSKLPGLNVKLYACPGNHEFLWEEPSGKEIIWLGAETAWLNCMKPYAANSNGPHEGGPDHLLTDQSWLSYSFDVKGSHFIVLNTDTWDSVGSYPYYWAVNDMANAAGNPLVNEIFIINHRPATVPNYSAGEDVGINPKDSLLWLAMEQYHVTAMISSHVHLFEWEQIHGKATQVITGNAGAELQKSMPSSMKYFGYCVITVFNSGKIIMKDYGRDLPSGSYLDPPTAPTTLRDSVNIAW
jgi:hypothetical protein